MARVERRSSERGILISAETTSGGVIAAHYGWDPSPDRPFTVFWRGRVTLPRLNSFFADTLPHHQAISVSATLFGPTDRIRLDHFRYLDELFGKIGEDVSFVRLECHTRSEPGTMWSLDYVVWSRVDLADVPPGTPVPDNIGVFLGPSHFSRIREPLQGFVVETNIQQMSQTEAADAFDALVPYLLHPRAGPDPLDLGRLSQAQALQPA